jgi:hypothetical protein
MTNKTFFTKVLNKQVGDLTTKTLLYNLLILLIKTRCYLQKVMQLNIYADILKEQGRRYQESNSLLEMILERDYKKEVD